MNKLIDEENEDEAPPEFTPPEATLETLSAKSFLVPIDVINSVKLYTCDFGLNQEGNAVVGDISMLAY